MIKYFENLGLKFASYLAVIFFKAKIKPLPVTIFRFIISAPLSLYFFRRGEYIYNVIGLLCYMVLAILDWVDGDLARLYKLPKETAAFGKFIDHTLDRILMLIILGSIIYAGMRGPNKDVWIIVGIAYYSVFFFVTALMYEFDRTFSLHIDSYPEIGKKMYHLSKSPSLRDKILYNLLYVHNNSVTMLFFTHNILLFIGIMTNLLLPVFIYFVIMHFIRSVGVFLITYDTLSMQPTKFTLAQVLRKYKV